MTACAEFVIRIRMSVVINNILSYIQSARDSDTATDILNTVEKFYKSKDIQKAKNVIFDAIQERAIFRHQVQMDIQDILDAFDTANAKQLQLPTYAAVGKAALPPANGYEFLKDTMDDVAEELSKMKREIATLKAQKQDTFRDEILKSIADFKKQMQEEFVTQIANLKNEFATMRNAKQPALDTHLNSTQATTTYADIIADDKKAHGDKKSQGKAPKQDLRLRYRSPSPKGLSSPSFSEAAKRPSNPANPGQAPKTRIPQNQAPQAAPKPRTRKPVIRGTKSVVGKPFGAVRYADLYIGGCYKDITEDDIKGYCNDILNVKFKDCVPLVTKSSRFSSFKLTLEFEDRNKLLDGELWPKNVVIRKFTQPRVAASNNSNDVGKLSQNKNSNVV